VAVVIPVAKVVEAATPGREVAAAAMQAATAVAVATTVEEAVVVPTLVVKVIVAATQVVKVARARIAERAAARLTRRLVIKLQLTALLPIGRLAATLRPIRLLWTAPGIRRLPIALVKKPLRIAYRKGWAVRPSRIARCANFNAK
jgi:hypothetical protein